MTRGQVFPFAQARRQKAGNANGRWRTIADEFAGDVWPALHPSFRIKPGQTIFTIGSCFARNIEQHLHAAGGRVPMLDFHLPPHEWRGAANGAMNKFHPPAFRQCLEWTAAIFDRDGRVGWPDCERLAFDWGDGRYFDMDMGATDPVSRERLIERRQHIYDIFSTVFSADCLMMTPGLIEAWRDRRTGLYTHEPPVHKVMVADRARWEFEILSYEQCLADMLAAIDVVRARNPDVKVLVTTSPVPIAVTFSGQDVRTANTYSKSVLRAVCGAATFQRSGVDYFPSYESAMLSYPDNVWGPDRIHVAQGFVGKIVTHMLDHYLEGAEAASSGYQSALTLMMNGAFPEAEQAALAALAARPDHLEARLLLAEARIRQNRNDEAEADLRGMARTHPDRAEVWITLARAISRGGGAARASETVAHIETALALPSVTVANFLNVAELVRRRAPPETAERLMRRAVELFPLHVEAYPALVSVLIDQGRTGEAIALLHHAVTLRRVRADMQVQLAGLLAGAGEAAEGRLILQQVLKLEPRHAAAAALLARLDEPAPTGPAPAPAELAQATPTPPGWARRLRRALAGPRSAEAP